MKQGKNVRKLIVRKMTLLMIPKGAGLAEALDAMRTPQGITGAASEATEWVRAALDAVKSAPDNPFGDDDEAIAGYILNQAGLDDEELAGRTP